MKRILIIALVTLCIPATAQDVNSYISKARSAYSSQNYEDARFNLQNALNEIEKAIAKEILAALPESLGGMTHDASNDDVSGSAGMLGLYVSRFYGDKEGDHADLTIADNSPMFGMVNAFLSNPVLSGVAGMSTGQKVVRIGSYKGMMQIDEEEDGSGSIMIPFGDSMLTINTNIRDESKLTAMAKQIPIDRIVSIVD